MLNIVSLQGNVGTKTEDAATCIVTATYDKDKAKDFRVTQKMDNFWDERICYKSYK